MDLQTLQLQQLSPQLLQSLNILRVPAQELRKMIAEELEKNPMLEVVSDFADTYRPTSLSRTTVGENSAETDPFSNIVAEETLEEHILAQVPELDESLKQALTEILGNLDENGFLTPGTSFEGENQTRAYQILRTLKPSGIGAHDLRDCLLMQLDPNTPIYKLIELHFDDLQHYRYAKIQRRLKISRSQLLRYLKELKLLNFSPKSSFLKEIAAPIIPEVIFESIDGQWHIEIRGIRLKLSDTYKTMFIQKLSRNDRSYLSKNGTRAKSFIKAVELRNSTLQSIAEIIFKKQQKFFEHGPEYLVPEYLNQTAADLELHPSTISRAIDQKYAKTPFGVFPLRYFFSGDMDGFSKNAVLEKILRFIKNEDKHEPLNDQQISELLAAEGCFIARRTVAKYRNFLKILPARTRKIS